MLGLGAGIAVHAAEYDQRLVNLSTRGQVGTGANVMITGFVIQSGAPKKVLIRAVGPRLATTPFNVPGTITNPTLALYNSANVLIASNAGWQAADAATMTSVGAFALNPGSADAAIVATLSPGTYTAQVSGANSGTGIALLEVYDVSGAARLLNLSTRAMVGSGANILISGLVVAPSAGNRRVLIRAVGPGLTGLGVPGALADPVISVLTSSGQLITSNDNWGTADANGQLAAAFLQGGAFQLQSGSKDAALLADLPPNASYTFQVTSADATTGLALVEVYDLTPDNGSSAAPIATGSGSLYVANLRTPAGAANSTAYGTATLQLSPDELSAIVSVTFSNLSSTETSAHLVIDGAFVQGLPTGQVGGSVWVFNATGIYSAADLVAALKAGRVYISIDTANYPSGELVGGLVKSNSSGIFVIPGAAPAINLTQITSADAARFLTQATFGTTQNDITALVSKGYSAWLTEQMGLAASLHRTATMADFAQYTQSATNTAPGGGNRQAAWWKIAVTGPDQLRQRVGFALSELFVISDQNGTVANAQEGMANYYDILVRGAFGNFRQVLEDVTLSPMMGIYLSSLRNAKATFDSKGAVLTSADENYAREVMQLFTIGLNRLQPDGTLQLDANGQPMPTYDQTTISETAKVFTGWAYFSTATNPNFRGAAADYINPMMIYPASHDDVAKTIVGGKVIPAGQGGAKDLKDTLDALFNHPNTGPFISRQLIQRLVTSNPSPGYVYRVAQVFANNGAGVRGDLGAVVRAILLDYEARSPALLDTPGHGKLREPLLRATAELRAFGGGSNSGRFNISNPESNLAQAALRATTVFNFFEPDYVMPGALASAGLYAPEFQISTATTAITVPNFLYTYIYNTRSTTDTTQQTIGLDLTALLPLATTPQQLVDYLNLVLNSGTMPKAMGDRIVTALNGMPNGTSTTEKVRSAIYLVMTSAEGSIQK